MSNAFDGPILTLLKLKAQIKKVEERHKEELAPLTGMKETLEQLILKKLQLTVGDQPEGKGKISTAYGTVFKTHFNSASLADPDAFMNYVIEAERYELLDRKANVTAVKEYMDTNDGDTPPGVKWTSTLRLGLHKAAGVNLEE